jgi:cobalt-zinc-cadmium efflux system outer membrane protein
MKYVIPMVLICATLTGCATTREREAFDIHARERATDRVAVPALAEDSSLDAYLRYAALNNAGLEAAFNLWAAALERIPQERALPDPRFNYGYFIQEVETRVGAQRQKLDLTQVFPWFGTLAVKGGRAVAGANVARQKYEAAKLKLFYNVKNAYYDYYYLGRARAITAENMRLMSDLENVARAKYTAGTAPHAAVIKAQVELGRLQDQLKTLEDMRNPVVATLNAALNRDLTAQLPWPTAISNVTVSLSDERLSAWLGTNNPELNALDSSADQSASSVALAKKGFYPNITLGVGVVDTADSEMAGVDESGKDPIVGMIGLTLPIWYGKNRAARREAEARHAAVLKQRVDRHSALLADLQMALFGLRDASRKIDLYGDTLVPKAKQSLNATRQGFESGKQDFLSLVDAERLLLEFQLMHEQALVNRVKRIAELEMLVGKNLRASE